MEEENNELSKRDRKKLNKEKKANSEVKSSMQNKLLVVGAIVAVAIGAFWFMYRGGNNSKTPTETPQAVSPKEVSHEDHQKGPEEALLTLVEYGDFQCPACAAYNPIVNQLSEEFANDLKIVYRHFPLRSIHRHAQISAQAAEAAGKQGKFWEMANILFERQDDWANVRDPRSLFVEYANELGLNTTDFETHMNSDEAKNAVNVDYDSGMVASVNSTPTFYIDGEKIVNPQGFEPFAELIRQKLAEKMPEGRGEEATDSAEASPEASLTPTL